MQASLGQLSADNTRSLQGCSQTHILSLKTGMHFEVSSKPSYNLNSHGAFFLSSLCSARCTGTSDSGSRAEGELGQNYPNEMVQLPSLSQGGQPWGIWGLGAKGGGVPVLS